MSYILPEEMSTSLNILLESSYSVGKLLSFFVHNHIKNVNDVKLSTKISVQWNQRKYFDKYLKLMNVVITVFFVLFLMFGLFLHQI